MVGVERFDHRDRERKPCFDVDVSVPALERSAGQRRLTERG
jgi:hypothetical protein